MHFLVPADIDNPARPSGGNVYDRRLSTGLTILGWHVVEHPVAGSWPHPGYRDANAYATLLTSLPDGALVLIDGLIALTSPGVLLHAGRLHVVILVHMLFTDTHDVGTGFALERSVLRCAAAVVATSFWTKRLIVDRHGVAPGRIAVVEPGTDAAPPARGTADGGELLCVASISAAKGHETLISALLHVADCQWQCTCAGALDLDATFTRELRDRAEEGGIVDRVHFPGALAAGELSARYAAADVLVLASRSETYGMVVTEALARGIPVIATDVGGIPEAMGRGATGAVPGLLVPPDDPGALAAALRRWFGDVELRELLRSAAMERREKLENWDATADRVSRILLPLHAAEFEKAGD
ncbi:glycosyltransferase family 4 protein [Arthrobacter sp.]|uniref:glycosyltransferase family 4 protein n=1 Tax=Arthrobacter sp. TaxID=1667 RepID=UPI0026DF8029|nr:glycosyltransferase family 4 protein [Arthrobacter sp.]MDO5753519.1 glycosyltransferase family 4 protein [Arthrobacter sp.]